MTGARVRKQDWQKAADKDKLEVKNHKKKS